MTEFAKCLVVAIALACPAALADDSQQAAMVLGVNVKLDDNGKPAAVDEATRLQLIENLRASFAARGVEAQTGPLRVSKRGVESMQIGLDRTAISVARIKEDGDLEMLCVHGEEEAADFLTGSATQ